ncbi:rho GTPase-activating protein 30 [Falco biarmicus]|uniref:rho GTPase-activating protein 30 n=1 Tax=Falco biarmicus TaxID=345155 RepID=UPI0024BC6F30|nr:rho GTPase-activating protein 30 [Falco biarmicus]
MSLALKARQKARRKGGTKERVFGCDLLEHLQQSGQDVPQVLRSCTKFVEQHGVVDGIYRLSGVSSNIQRLRQEFDSDRCPDLQKDVYLQDIHCVSSLCKAYFRELPNPLLTYQLYDKFSDAVAIQMEEARLVKIKEVLKELPVPHYRTLEFLMRHLLHMASYSSQTNMHARNLAIVWAPNLLRSKDIEATGFNGTAAFMEVRVQSIVVEFILTHVEQLFGDAPLRGGESSRRSLLLGGGGPGDGQPPPYHVPAVLSQGDGPPPIRPYHTIIELSDHRRKGSLKAKKWRSIFNLGRSSHEAKRKLVKTEEKDDKCGKVSLRPAKSMDSLSSVPFASDGKRGARRCSVGTVPVPKAGSSGQAWGWRGHGWGRRAQHRDGEGRAGMVPQLSSSHGADQPGPRRGEVWGQGPPPCPDSSSPPGADDPRLSKKRSVKQPLQRRESFDTCPSPRESCPELDESLEDQLKGKEEQWGPESEGESSTKSEPTTPKAGQASLVAPGRSPKTTRSRAEKCAGVHISGPFSVTVPFHITSNLSRLTRGLPCPVLAQAAVGRELPASPPPPPPLLSWGARGTGAPQWEEKADAEETRLSLELRDSFAFLDSQETWLEGVGDMEPAARSLLPDTGPRGRLGVPGHRGGDGERVHEREPTAPSPRFGGGPGEPPVEQPASYLSIEECMDEEMFFMAPSGSDAEDPAGDTDSDDMFLSAHDDLSPLVVSLEPLDQLPGEGTAPETASPPQPGADSTVVPQDKSPAPGPAGTCPVEEDAPGEGEHPGDPAGVPAEVGAPGTGQPPGEGSGGEGAADSGSSPSRTDSNTEASPEEEAGGVGSHVGAGLVPDTSAGEVEEDGAGSGPPTSEEPEEDKPQLFPASPPTSSLEEPPEEPEQPPCPGPVPEALPLPAASAAGTSATPGGSPRSPSLSASAPELCGTPPEGPQLSRAEPPGGLGHAEPAAVLRRDGSAPVRLAARTVRVQQARSVPVVPPKPQFAKVPPALQPCAPLTDGAALATAGDAAPLPQRLPSPTAPEGSPQQPGAGKAAAGARRAGWRGGGSISFDAAVAMAAEQQLAQAPVRRIQTYGGGELVPAAPKALPFHQAPLRPRLLRPLSCMAAPEGEAPGRSRLGLARPAAQVEGAALSQLQQPVGTEGAAGER